MLLFSVILISLLIYKECRFYFTQNSTNVLIRPFYLY